MKNKITIFLFIILVLFVSCKNDYPNSVFDLSYQSKPQPVITSITPLSTVAAVGDLTINGSNFSTVKEENFIYFDKTKVIPYFASATQLKVTPPNTVSDSVKIVVIVQGADMYSDPPVKIQLSPAFIEYGAITSFDDPWSIEMDAKENLYVSMSLGNSSKVIKIAPDQSQTDYATSTFPYAKRMKFGPDGSLYITRLIPLIYRIPAGGGAAAVYVTLPNAGKAFDLDFDQDGNMWVVGNNNEVYRVKPDKTIKTFPFIANARSARVYDGYLYVAGKDADLNEFIWKSKIISADELGPRENIIDWTKSLKGPGALSITFAKDGDMYVGTDGPDSISVVVIHPSGIFNALYPGYLLRTGEVLSWGEANSSKWLFICRRNDDSQKRKIMKIYMGKDGAPYYGRK